MYLERKIDKWLLDWKKEIRNLRPWLLALGNVGKLRASRISPNPITMSLKSIFGITQIIVVILTAL